MLAAKLDAFGSLHSSCRNTLWRPPTLLASRHALPQVGFLGRTGSLSMFLADNRVRHRPCSANLDLVIGLSNPWTHSSEVSDGGRSNSGEAAEQRLPEKPKGHFTSVRLSSAHLFSDRG